MNPYIIKVPENKIPMLTEIITNLRHQGQPFTCILEGADWVITLQ